MASVYRIIFAPDVEVSEFRKGTDRYDECRAEIFERFKKHKFIGTGWGSLPLKAGMSEAEIRVAANAPTGQIENFRCLCEIAENDLIWMIHKGNYYLFRVKENKVGTNWLREKFGDDADWYLKRDISNCFTVDICEVGNEIGVPGVVINSMSIGTTLRKIKKAPELTMDVWNRKSDSHHYNIKTVPEEWFWDLMTDRQKEGLALSYIQVKYGCIVNTESLKHSTAVYECELIDAQGKRYLPQVKTGTSGNKAFPVKDYCKEIEKMSKELGFEAVPVLFYENEDYGDYESKTLIKLTQKELLEFIRDYPQYISNSVMNAYNLMYGKE